MYGYLAWDIILGIAWTLAYCLRADLRQKMLWSSLLSLPFGLGELYFIPQYWMPQTLFNLGATYRADIESFALMFLLGGIAAGVYEGWFKKHIPSAQKICHPFCRCYTPLIAALTAFIVITRSFPAWNIVYPSSLACLAGGAAAMLIYPQLRKHVLFGGVLFALLYWISLAITNIVVPGWIANTWNMHALSGITLIGVPVEELLFGFSFGTLWAPLFEEVCANLHGLRRKV